MPALVAGFFLPLALSQVQPMAFYFLLSSCCGLRGMPASLLEFSGRHQFAPPAIRDG